MNFLQLVRALRRETSTAGNGPTTTINQDGEMERLVEWINTAHNSVQTERVDWFFLWKQASQVVTTRYPAKPDDHNVWDVKRFLLDGMPLDAIEYCDYDVPLIVPVGRPSTAILMPDGSLMFDAVPDVAYTLQYDYYRTPKVLTSDTDIPLIPEQYHRVILGDAMIRYADYESAPEIGKAGDRMFQEYIRKLLHAHNEAQRNYQRTECDMVMDVY